MEVDTIEDILRDPRTKENLYEVSNQQGRSFRGILTNYNELNGTATFLLAIRRFDGKFIVLTDRNGIQRAPININSHDINSMNVAIDDDIPSILSKNSNSSNDTNYSKRQETGGTKRRKYKRKSVKRKRIKRTRRAKR